MLNMGGHKKRFQEILDISNSNTSLDEFTTVIKQEIQYYENNLDDNMDYLMQEIVTGKKINVIKDTPVIWCFIALYWSYNLQNKDQTLITEIYNPKIGDVALKFLLFFLRMKQKEARIVCVKHKSSFYEDLSARLVRIIDILPVMDVQTSKHLEEIYFPNSQTGLALNFLKVQVENPWEGMTLSIKIDSKTGKNIIQYKHNNENLNFIIRPSRMTKDGAFRDLDKTYNQLMQLWNLDLASDKTRYGSRDKRKSSKNKVIPNVTPLEEELIYVDSIDSDALTSEDQIENLSKRKVYRRDMEDLSAAVEDSEDEAKEYVIPNEFQQHKQNVAFSASLSKQKLLLQSDYNIPTKLHLKAFCASLPFDNVQNKAYTGFFILSVVLGSKPEDIMHLLQAKKKGPLEYTNATISIKIDDSIFANHRSSLLDENENTLKFGTHITLSLLILFLQKTIHAKEFKKRIFLVNYKRFLKYTVKEFTKTITINWDQTHRYLAQYIQENGKDVLTGKLITSSYTQNDTAKLAYTSTRSNATEHSRLLIEYWNELHLDGVAKKIIDINVIPTSNTSSVSLQSFTGSSQVVNAKKATAFFMALQNNILDTKENQDLYFNLVSIYSRYAMSILAGTRTFKESGNFTSYNEELDMWFISEKAQDIASGTRLVPICDTLKSILHFYQKLLKEKDLENNFYLTIDGVNVPFTAYIAHKIIKNTPNLEDGETLEEYVRDVPLNTGRHLLVRKAIDELVNVHYISAYLGHYTAGEEHLGIYSTLDIREYKNVIKTLTTKIAHEHGIKEL